MNLQQFEQFQELLSVNNLHPSNSDDPIDLSFSVLNDIFVNDEQFLNELSGICSFWPLIVNERTPLNASFSIV